MAILEVKCAGRAQQCSYCVFSLLVSLGLAVLLRFGCLVVVLSDLVYGAARSKMGVLSLRHVKRYNMADQRMCCCYSKMIALVTQLDAASVCVMIWVLYLLCLLLVSDKLSVALVHCIPGTNQCVF